MKGPFTAILLVIALAAATLRAETPLYVAVQLSSNSELKLIVARSVENRDGVIYIVGADGKSSIIQQKGVLGMVHGMDPEVAEVSLEDAQKGLKEVDDFAAAHPEAAPLVDSVRKAWAGAVKNAEEALQTEEKFKKSDEAVTALLAVIYQPEGNYNINYVGEIIQRGETCAASTPARAQEIELFLAPWREEKKNLEEGKVKKGGHWFTEEDLERQAIEIKKKEMEDFYKKEGRITLDGVVVDSTTVYGLAGVFVLSVLTFLYLVLHGITALRTRFDIMPVLCLFAGLGGLGLYAYFGMNAIEYPKGWDAANGGIVGGVSLGDASAPDELIYLASTGKKGSLPSSVILHDSEINAFIADHVRFTGSTDAASMQVVCRAVKVGVTSSQIMVFQTVTFFDREVILSFTVNIVPNGSGYDFAVSRVDVGGARLPGSAASVLWGKFYYQALGFLNHIRLLDACQVEKFDAGTVELSRIKK